MLRKRTDSHAYDVDTLFLGTLLFTLTAFLAPTVLAYAALFASVGETTSMLMQINFASNAAQRILAVAVAALNSVPVFELTERVMRPENVPGEYPKGAPDSRWHRVRFRPTVSAGSTHPRAEEHTPQHRRHPRHLAQHNDQNLIHTPL